SAGAVARIRIFDRALSAAQVAALDRSPAIPEFYSITWNNAAFGTNILTAVAFDSVGVNATSPPVTLIINRPPPNTNAPTIASVIPAAGAIVTNLTSIQVTFSERVVGVNNTD